jgi:hypothetical protein
LQAKPPVVYTISARDQPVDPAPYFERLAKMKQPLAA